MLGIQGDVSLEIGVRIPEVLLKLSHDFALSFVNGKSGTNRFPDAMPPTNLR